jgi:hypothetical protein
VGTIGSEIAESRQVKTKPCTPSRREYTNPE